METEKHCPNCGNPLGAGALEGMCPACMLKMGADPGSVPTAGPNITQVAATSAHGAPPVPLKIGSEFGGYRIHRRLGHGGMGVVYEAEETGSGRRVALKVIQQRLDSPRDRARFLREGRLAASINHPNCVYVFGTEEIDGIPVIAMEFVAGGTLEQRLRKEGPQPVARTVDAVLQVISGLEAAQEMGILHRDIKPSNCFEDEQGTVKIGDFGLSISTAPRAESLITESGAMAGTPAFCAPEQLRGEELNERTDMYAVGVMLYQLLTGRLPFEGKSMPQLISNALEQRAPSPRSIRKDIPAGLARVILRCLAKQPSDRFRNYAALHRALAPYSSTAATPATLGLRFLAGLLDQCILNVFSVTAMFLFMGGFAATMDRMLQHLEDAWRIALPSMALVLLYYALTEWRWGATPGKAICRVRVVRPDGSFPTLGRALGRAVSYVLLPVLPYWIMIIATGDLQALFRPAGLNAVLAYTQFLLVAALFSTARRRNGFAAVQDLLTDTRIVSRAAVSARPAILRTEDPPVADEASPRIGPYHVLRSLGGTGGVEWTAGYDLRLLRRVLIRGVPPGTPAWPTALCPIARVGRLRWLTGRRQPDENWDAFEDVGGHAFTHLAQTPQPWSRVRFWLYDLASELEAAERDGTVPVELTMGRIWITEAGRAKLFDVPVPGCEETVKDTVTDAGSGPPSSPVGRATAFLHEVTVAALGGMNEQHQPADQVAVPLPLHARKVLTELSAMAGPEPAARAIQPLLRRTPRVTRWRRGMIAASCIVIPLVLSLMPLMGLSFMNRMASERPEQMQLITVLQSWDASQKFWTPKKGLPTEEDFGVYIATHHSDRVADEATWSGTLALTMISREARAFAEASVEQYASVSPERKAEAGAAVGALLKYRLPSERAKTPNLSVMFFAGIVTAYVALPALIAALLFRGGLVLFAAGVTFARRDGRPASRLRLFWRAIVTWVPMFTIGFFSVLWATKGSIALSILAGGAVCGLVIVSVLLPVRGLQDRLAGTWPVPR